ncbi:hypothetical protein, partial [Catelliglobosispora koreensis]|uniref:hypothetical protein n=1 Tax=Catelliglobosispora koreensis TaxID=129052 RepID=UPI00058C0B63
NVNGTKHIYTIINGKVYEASSANGWTNLWTGVQGVSSGALAATNIGSEKVFYTTVNGVVYEASSNRGWNNLRVSGASGDVRASTVAAIEVNGVKYVYTR